MLPVEKGRGKKRRKKPTLKQIKAIQYINQGDSKYKAMIKAGYSVQTARVPSRNLMNSDGVKIAIDTMATELADAGLTAKYMVAKFKEWLEAKKTVGARVTVRRGKTAELEEATSTTDDFVEVPDYDTQLRGYREWKKVMDENRPTETGKQKVKRRLTIDEFVLGEEEPT